MPTLFCTAKLSKLFGVRVRYDSVSMDNWNGHLFSLEKRKCIVVVHKETFYSVVLFDVLKGDLGNFDQMFLDNYLEQLKNDGLLTDAIQRKALKEFPKWNISVTDDDKSAIGYINDCIKRLTWPFGGDTPTITGTKEYVKKYYNENLIGSRGYVSPIELMRSKL